MSMKTKWLVTGFMLASVSPAVFSGQAETTQIQSEPQGPDPEQIYSALGVREWRLSFRDPDTGVPRVGATVLEKEVGGLLCRKTSAVVPEPVPRYQCFSQLTLSDGQAMTLFQLLNARALDVGYLDVVSVFPRVGVTVMEKTTDDLICQSMAPVILNPVPSYTCYTDIREDTLRLVGRHDEKERRDRY